MTKEEIRTLVEQVTNTVLSTAEAEEQYAAAPGGGRRLLFLCGEHRMLPEKLAQGRTVCALEDYEQNPDITRYETVVIGHLSTARLSDLALARMSDPVTCAVLHALLAGVEVLLLDGALSFQKYKGQGSPALYKQLNDYVHTLQIYGIKLYIDRDVKKVEVRPLSHANPAQETETPVSYRSPRGASIVQTGSARPNAGLLITEADAVSMIAQLRPEETLIRLDPGSILTPSARDVFLRHRIEVV